jgi:sigma-E factor negative regulatory protein RseB
MRGVALAAALAAGAAVHWSGALAQGEANADAIAWLQKIYRSTERLSYTGTFVFQQGEQVETSRITRIVDGSGVHERLEALDGTPREIIRVNEEVKCYLPQTMTVKVERQVDTRPFPAMRADAHELAQYYSTRSTTVSARARPSASRATIARRSSSSRRTSCATATSSGPTSPPACW